MPDLPQRLAPPETRPHVSVVRLPRAWYVACPARALGSKALARKVLGQPMVLFRDATGAPHALLDRCPHRNVPLSLGRVREGTLECRYHGWRFTGSGACALVPGLTTEGEARARRAVAFPTREVGGWIFVWAEADGEPDGEPFQPPPAAPGTTIVRHSVTATATLHATIENALDVPHTAFLHAGLFRGASEPNDIEAVIRRIPGGVEAEFLGEPRPSGLIGSILAPSGGVVEHTDRFLLPSIAQVHYRLGGGDSELLVTAWGTPEEDFTTTLHSEVRFKTRIPGWLLRPFVQPLALRIFAQDAVILEAQTDVLRRFGGEQFVSTEIDVLGREIWRLMRQAERGLVGDGHDDDDAPRELRRIQLRV